jgi:uncharacterized protein (TIGR00369 family)
MPDGPSALDGVTTWMGVRWLDANTVRLTVRPELLNLGGMLSGVVAYTLVDYSMGSALWAQREPHEAIATASITINYLRAVRGGELECVSTVDRRTPTSASLRSEVRDDEDQVVATAVGTFTIFVPRDPPLSSRPSPPE